MSKHREPPRRLFREPRDHGPGGPEGLRQWVLDFVPLWQSAYRAARVAGWGADTVICAVPESDRADIPPYRFMPFLRNQRGSLTRQIPGLRGSLDRAAPAGLFYVVATKGTGRLKGSFVGMLSCPEDDEDLPAFLAVMPPAPESN